MIPDELTHALREFTDSIRHEMREAESVDQHALQQVVVLLESAIAVLEERRTSPQD